MRIWSRIQTETGFRVLHATRRGQLASMALAPGEKLGGSRALYADADYWIYVLTGEGVAKVEGETVTLEPGRLLLIESGETHEIANTATGPLEILNIYAPPVYKSAVREN